MTTIDNKELFVKKSFNISQQLGDLINNFNFYTEPQDGIKDVKVTTLKLNSFCNNYKFSLDVRSSGKKAISDAIRKQNISTDNVIIKEIGLNIIFHHGFYELENGKVPVKIKYCDKVEVKNTNPMINKYLQHWGLKA